MPKKIIYAPGSTQKLYQLTGECDRERKQFTINRTELRFGLTGTDLGSSFKHNGRIYFLFGDTGSTNPNQPFCGDSIAYTEDNDPEEGLHLNFVTAPTDPNNYLCPSIRSPPNISLGCFEVPTAGFSANNKMYVFFTTNHYQDANGVHIMGRSVLTWSGDAAQSPFNYLYDLSDATQGGKFINVSTAIVNNADISGLPDTVGQGLLLWGGGLYRRSNLYLAYLPLSGVEDKSNLRYFAGIEAGSRRPIWSTQESDAIALFNHPEIGELSVTWNQFLNVWLILYNAGNPRGINFRTAEKPWGPWSPTSLLFEPTVDGGYCHFMHVSWDVRICDSVYDGTPGHDISDFGGEYGPYVISRYTKGDSTKSTIYFLMSTWNPYNTVLMKSTLALESGEIHTQLSGNPVLIQSFGYAFGAKGNFQVMSPQISGGLVHYWRNSDNTNFPWSMPISIAVSTGQLNALSLIQSNFGNPGNLVAIARTQDKLLWLWGESQAPFIWHGPYPLVIENASDRPCFRGEVTGIDGNPVLVQSKFGNKGNFELIVPRADSGFDHYFRNNDDPALPWIKALSVGVGQGHINAISFIQSNFGNPGNLEVIARSDDRLRFFFRTGSESSNFTWNGPFPIIVDEAEVTGISGNPVLIQSRFGNQGNFELIVPRFDSGFDHYFRDNDDSNLPWKHTSSVGVGQCHIDTISFIQSNFGNPGNLEVVARAGDQLVHFWRDSGPGFNWNGVFNFTSE